jgi:hypothetical protein
MQTGGIRVPSSRGSHGFRGCVQTPFGERHDVVEVTAAARIWWVRATEWLVGRAEGPAAFRQTV